MKKSIYLILILTVSLFSACKKDKKEEVQPEPTPSPDEIIVADQTIVIGSDARLTIASIDTSNYTFVFNGGSSFVTGLSVGDILVDSTSDMAPFGYLRKVTQVSEANGVKTVQTEPAGLTEAVLQGSLEFDKQSLKTSQINRVKLAKGVSLNMHKNPDFTVFDMDYHVAMQDGSQKLNIDGHTELSLDVFFHFDWEFCFDCLPPSPQINLFETGVVVNQGASINLVSGNGITINETVDIATFYFEPWTFSIGPVPVVFVPEVNLFMDAKGTITAQFSVGASESVNGRVGLKYTSESGWDEISEIDSDYDFYAPSLDIDANIKSHVGPKLSLKLYGIAGPYFATLGCEEFDAHLYTGTNNWDLTYKIGAVARLGVEVDALLFEFDKHVDFCLFEKTLIDLHEEPMETAVYFQYPVDGSWLPIGGEISIETRVTGIDPEKIQFFVDGSLIDESNNYPYSFIWNTVGYSLGFHQLVVTDIISNQIVSSDTMVVELKQAAWEVVDFGSYGQNNETINSDIFFENESTGWMAGGTAYGFSGYILKTIDGGESWENLAPAYALTFHKIIFMNSDMLVLLTGDEAVCSYNWELLHYFEGDEIKYPFENTDIYDADMSMDGKIVAVVRSSTENVRSVISVNAAYNNFYPVGGFAEIPHTTILSGAPKIIMKNSTGLVYNILDDNNPLKQYIMLSNDAGSTWTDMPLNATGITSNDAIKDAFFLDEQNGWLVGRESQGYAFVLITHDAGISWEKVNVEDVHSFSSVWFLSESEGYATVDVWNEDYETVFKLYHTLDGGLSWNIEEISNQQLGLKRVYFKGQNIGYAIGQGAKAYRFRVGK